ncbi:MAG: extracellular solute-binding protein [Clostridiales bacterium]|nr:extracellular solute-binding protein [Clostridiales bacterium]
MKKVKLLSLTMAAVVLMTTLTSCFTSTKKGKTTVEEDDPWYESTKFEMVRDISIGEEGSNSYLSVTDDRIFSLYCVTADKWCSARLVLDIYDYEGNMLTRHNVTVPENITIDNLYSSSVDPEGKTITAVVDTFQTNHTEVDFIDIDTESGTVTSIKDLCDEEARKAIKPDFDIFEVVSYGNYTIALLWGTYRTGGDTNRQILLFKDREFVQDLDLSYITFLFLLGGFSVDESTDSIFIGVGGVDDNLSLEFDMTTGERKNARSFREEGEEEIDLSEYATTNDGDICKIDSLGNIIRIDPDTHTPVTVIDANWYTPYFSPVYSEEQGVTSKLVSCNEERTVILDDAYIMYGSDVPEKHAYIRVLTKADKNPHVGKKVIEIALPPNSGVSDYLAKTIYEFNKTDNEYLVRVWDKYNSGFTPGLVYGELEENEQEVYRMIQDLRGGDAPDIVLNIQKNYAMNDRIFMDITGFLDPEVLDKQYGNIIEAGRINGRLYFLPVTIEIEGLVTNEELLKEGAEGITFEEFEKLIKDEMNGFSPYDYPNSRACNKRTFLLSCIDTKRAIEGDKVEIGTDQFRAAAEYAKNHFEYDNEKSVPLEYVQDWNRYRGECYYARIGNYLDYVTSCYRSKGNYKIIGTPSVDAAGPRFKAIETVSVSAATDVKDGCKKFLNYMFSGSAYDSSECEFRFTVTNKEIMDRNIEFLTKKNNAEYAKFRASVSSGSFIPAPGYEKAFGDKNATDDMGRNFKESLNTISTYYYEDHQIEQFLDEELAPYFADACSIDDVIKYLNDRLTKYVREM